MKWSFASAGLIIFGLFGLMIILLFHEITVSNEQDYYTLKKATEAAMIDAVDSAYYRLTGKIKISEEKFVESFTKRFSQTATFGQGNYYINFYQITEYPAKVSLRIIDNTSSYSIYTTYDESLGETQTKIVNELSAILDGYEIDDKYDYIQGVEIDPTTGQYIQLGGGTSGYTMEQPQDSVRPTLECKQYNTLKNNPMFMVSNLVYDFVHEMCSFVIVMNSNPQAEDEYNTAGMTYQTDKATITCPSTHPYLKPSGWCTKTK